MDNKNYNTSHSDEYRLPETGSESHFEPTTAEPKIATSIFERINRRHILFGFFLVFLTYCTYQLLSKTFHVLATKRELVAKQVAMAKNKPIPSVVPTPQATPLTTTQNEVKKLTQSQVTLQSALQTLTMQLSYIQSNLNNLNSQLSQMGSEVQTLQTRQTLLIKKTTPPPKKNLAAKKEPLKPIYYVRAIIPGRVWLTTPSGETLTLGLGDTLSGYGSIESINPDQGLITLSSGATIGYSPSDR